MSMAKIIIQFLAGSNLSAKGSPLWGSWREAPERARPVRQNSYTAISRLFVRAMLSPCLRFPVSVLALSVTFGDTSPKGRGLCAPALTESFFV
jgi:hypothetical protein